MTLTTEKRSLQIVVTMACLVPLFGGGAGVYLGARILGGGTINLDSHVRYLSGLLLAIGFAFLTTLPDIERQTGRFRLLTLIVVAGGLSRLLGMFLAGLPSEGMMAALGMELIVTPLLCLWQGSLAARSVREFDQHHAEHLI